MNKGADRKRERDPRFREYHGLRRFLFLHGPLLGRFLFRGLFLGRLLFGFLLPAPFGLAGGKQFNGLIEGYFVWGDALGKRGVTGVPMSLLCRRLLAVESVGVRVNL